MFFYLVFITNVFTISQMMLLLIISWIEMYVCFSLQACGSRGKALLEKAMRNNVSFQATKIWLTLQIYGLIFCGYYWRLTWFVILTLFWWICLVGTAAGEQRFGQCPIVGSEDCVCGWYPFEQITCSYLWCSEPLLTAEGTMWVLMCSSVSTSWRYLLLTTF